jgi:hypothetical protein
VTIRRGHQLGVIFEPPRSSRALVETLNGGGVPGFLHCLDRWNQVLEAPVQLYIVQSRSKGLQVDEEEAVTPRKG